jgi:hypothetical protein
MHDLIHGQWQAEVVRAVMELRIPELLGGQARMAGELAAEAGADPDRLARLLALAVALGLFEEPTRGQFRNNAASELLSADSPFSMRAEAAHQLSAWTRVSWDALEMAVRESTSGFAAVTGQGVFEYLEQHPAEAAVFHAFQAEVTRRNVRALLAGQTQFPPDATVVDVGGGDGALLMALLARRPDLRGVLFDQPSALHGATAADGRLTRVPGDFFACVPGGHEVYVLSHILHDWPDERARQILRRIAAAMTAESVLIIMENLNSDPPVPLIAYLDVLMLAAWDGRERTLPQYESLLAGAGLALAGHELLEPRTQLAALRARLAPDRAPGRRDARPA